MYIGTFDAIHTHSDALQQALKFLHETDFTTLKDGEYPIGDSGIFARVSRYKTHPANENLPETHTKMIDVQYVAQGEEFLGWCPFSPELEIAQEYDPEKDLTLYKKLVPDSNIILSPGLFAILYPLDVHRGGGSLDDDEPSDVLKVVVKVPVSLVE